MEKLLRKTAACLGVMMQLMLKQISALSALVGGFDSRLHTEYFLSLLIPKFLISIT